jgi:hypothetical protein
MMILTYLCYKRGGGGARSTDHHNTFVRCDKVL